MSTLFSILEGLDESKREETFDIFRIVDVGDNSSDKMPLGSITGSLSSIKREATKKYGKIVDVDVKKKEIIVEETDPSNVYSVYVKGQNKKAKFFDDFDDALKFAKKKLNSLVNSKVIIPVKDREVYVAQGDDILAIVRSEEVGK